MTAEILDDATDKRQKTRKLRVASFFSGIGGFELGLARAGHETVWACEVDPFARSVYAARFGRAPDAEDVRHVEADAVPDVDLWCGGFPCQDLSVAGRRAGFSGDRSGLVWTMLDLAARRRPEWILLENVPGMLTADKRRGFGRLLARLDQLGYVGCWRGVDAQFFLVPQRRRRVFVLARRAGARFDPGAVLLDAEGGDRDPAPRGEAGAVHASRARVGAGRGRLVAHAVTTRASERMSAEDNEVVLRAADVAATLTSGGENTGSPSGRRHEDQDNLVAVLGAFNAYAESGRGGNGESVAAASPVRGSNPPAVILAARVASTVQASAGHHGHSSPRGDGRDNLVAVLAVNSRGEVRTSARAGRDSARPGGLKQAQWVVAPDGTSVAVRRFLPVECERLQGFPDGWTDVPFDGKPASDGKRYKAIGNAVATTCVEWIGRRLNAAMERFA